MSACACCSYGAGRVSGVSHVKSRDFGCRASTRVMDIPRTGRCPGPLWIESRQSGCRHQMAAMRQQRTLRRRCEHWNEGVVGEIAPSLAGVSARLCVNLGGAAPSALECDQHGPCLARARLDASNAFPALTQLGRSRRRGFLRGLRRDSSLGLTSAGIVKRQYQVATSHHRQGRAGG